MCLIVVTGRREEPELLEEAEIITATQCSMILLSPAIRQM